MDVRKLCCAVLGATWMGTACITVTTVNIGTKTSLENQLMGAFEPLTDAEMLASSVRAAQAGSSAALLTEDAQSRAVAARRRQLFNRDDVRELKAAGCLGEGLGAKLVARDCSKAPGNSQLMARLITDENADRDDIMAWALASDAGLSAKDRDEVTGVYHRLLVEQSMSGDWVQQDDGTWQQR